MKTIFDIQARNEIIMRIGSLSLKSEAEWGKMTLIQMVKHNVYWNNWILGTEFYTYKQALLGKIFGKIALKRMIKNEKPFDKNIPTSSQFNVQEKDGDLEAEKLKWISLTKAFENFDNPAFIHDFFGKMNMEQIGILAYKHSDHHLRQFGC